MAEPDSMASPGKIKTLAMRKRKSDIKEEVAYSPKKVKAPENVAAPAEVDEVPSKILISFSVTEFRSQLRGVEGLKWLRDFANCVEWKTADSDVVIEYLKAGGSIAEITSLLDVTAQGDLATALPVFRAVYHILVKIQSGAKEYEEEARQGIENLLSTYVAAIQAMISLNSQKHRKVVLKMLTAIVTFHPSFGRQILNWFSLTPPQQEKFCEPGAVRKAFVMFLVAFFVDGRASLFRPLIEKKGLLSSIIPNLKFDEAETVAIVLTVLKDKMLTNPGVPKTTKLNVFNTQAIQSLFQLYDWIGPKGAQKGWKKPRKLATADEEKLAMVTAALDELLLLLCTCRKHGVVFWDKGLGTGTHMNQLIFTALEVIPRPWKKTETSQLVVKILAGSPDLIRHCLVRWGPSFEPRESTVWVQAVDFLIETIRSLNPDAIVPAAVETLSATQLQTALRSLLLSPIILKHIAAALNAEQPLAIRCHALRLLTAIITKLNAFLSVLASHFTGIEQLKKNLTHPLNVVIPQARIICDIWQEVLDEASPLKLPSPKDEVVAEFLLALAQLEPALLDNPRRLCKTLIPEVDSKDSAVQSAVLQTISLLDPTFLSPDSEQFEAALRILLLLTAENKTKKGSISALATMLLSTGLWDNGPQALDCWLGAWLRVPEGGRAIVSQVLVQAVRRVAQTGGDTLVSVLEETISIAEESRKDLKKSEIAKLSSFFTNLVIQLGCLFGDKIEITPTIRQWTTFDVKLCLQGDTTQVPKIPDPVQKNLVNFLLGTTEEQFNLPDCKPDAFQWTCLFGFTLHYLREWLRKGEFDEDHQSRCETCLKVIINGSWQANLVGVRASGKTLVAMDPSPATFFNKATAALLGDPELIRNFQLIGEDSFTQWMKTIVVSLKLSESKSGRRVDPGLLLSWKARLLQHLRKVVRSKKNLVVSEDLDFWMSFLRPTVEDLTPIQTALCSRAVANTEETSTSSALGSVWLSVLRLIGSQSVPRNLVTDIVQHLCKIVVLPSAQPEYEEALHEIITNFPLVVLDVPKDFMKDILMRAEVGDRLIDVAELCIQKHSHKEAFVETVCGAAESVNVRATMALFDTLLQRPGTLRRAVLASKPNDVAASLLSLNKRLHKTLPALSVRAWPSIESFLCGKEDSLLSKHIPVVLVLLKELGKNDVHCKMVADALKGKCPRLETIATVASVVDKVGSSVLLPWLQTLCTDPATNMSWEKQAAGLLLLLRNEDYLKEFVSLRQTKTWTDFVNNTLKGLSTRCDPFRFAILRAVTAATWSEDADNRELATMFNKCTSHSEFLAVMLSDSPVKEEVVGLILALVRFWPAVMVQGHIPVYLAAYNASLSSCDQRLLELLRVYERHCGSLSKFDPLFWGQPAISHYSVRGSGNLSLWTKVSMKSILELLDFDKMKKTIAQFPIHRTLQGSAEKSSPDLLDPAFLMPLFSNLFSPGAVSYCLSFVHQGALSLTIAALSSTDAGMRGAAAVVLSRFYAHLQLTQNLKQKPAWLHIVDCIRFGLDGLSTTPVPGVVTVFLARAVLEVADPLAPLHSLHRFLLAKPAFNLKALPEFIPLFYSDDLNHATHRVWIAEGLRDGIRQDIDVNLVVKGPALKILLTAFSVPSTSIELKSLVLQVLEKLVQIGTAAKSVLEELGLVSWLRNVSCGVTGPLVQPFVSLLKAVIHYLLQLEDKSEKAAKRLCSVSRLEVVLGSFASNVAKNASLKDISRMLEISVEGN